MTNSWKRICSLILAIVMVIGMIPTNFAFATETDPADVAETTAVAKVGETGYETLAAAIAAATAGQTITFVADITEDVTINKALTIDGAGKTYTGAMELKADTTIKNVNFDGKGYNGYAVETRGAQYLTIEDCTAQNYGYGFVQLASATALTTVKNVTVSNMNYGVKVDYSNAVVLENVDMTAGVAAVLNSNYGEKTITIKNSKLNILGTWTRNNTTKTNYVFEGENSIDKFIIDAAIDNFKLAAGATLTAPEEITVTTVEDYEVKYENGTYTSVAKPNDVVTIGTQGYATLADALAAAKAGDTITFVADITEDVTVSKAVTIDGAGKTYTGAMELKADTTIKNVNFDGQGYNGYAVETRGAQYLTIEDCTAKNYGFGFVQLASATALTTVKNVTVSNMNYGVKVDYSNAVVLENVDMTAGVAAVLNSNYGEKTITIKNSKLNILGTWTRNNTTKTNYVFEGANTIDNFITDAAIDNFKLAAGATLTAPNDITVTTDVADHEVEYNNGVYAVVEAKKPVAMIGETGYETLAAALKAATAGQTITFVADITEDVTISKAVTIDGAGKTYTGAMTLKADTTIKNVNFDGKGYNGYAITTRGANYLTIEDCTAKNYGYGFVQLASGTVLTTVKNVTVSNMNYGVKIDYSNAVVLENVDITAGVAAVLNSNYGEKPVTIKDSKLNILATWTRNNTTKTTYVFEGANTVNSFVVDANVDVFKLAADATLTAPNDITVTTDVADHEVKYNNGVYAVVEAKKPVAMIGETGYETLADAIAAANAMESATVTLLTDVVLDAPLVVTGTVVLELAGKTVTYNSTTQNEAMITNTGNLTINDTVGGGVINYNYTGAADPSYGKGNYTISNAGMLTVNGGKITIADLRQHAKYPINNNSTTGDAVLVINGGHLYNYNTSAIRQFCNSTTYKNSVTIIGGVIEGYSAIWVQNPGKNTVNGSLSITGGEIKTTAAAYVNGTSALKDVASKIYCTTEGGAWSEDSAVSITGGVINENVYLAEAAPAAITIGEGATFNGRLELPAAPVAKVGETPYETLAEAVAAANAIEGGATVTLLDDVTLGETLTISGDVTISGEHTITRADNWTKTLFTVNAGAKLTLDGGLVIDGGNNWVMDKAAYQADLDNFAKVAKADSAKWFTPEEGAPVATAFMITTTGGTVNLNKVTIQNNYSVGSGVISAGAKSTINLTGAQITHVAATQGNGVAVKADGAGIVVNMNEGTVIDGNHVGSNHGVFMIYSGAVFTMNGGEIKNTTGWNSNGVVVGLYWGTFIMNGGKICSNSSANGPNNGRCAAIYLHSGHTFKMTGGEICHNRGGSRGGVDASYSNGSISISGGYIGENSSYYVEQGYGASYPADVNLPTNGTATITGGSFTQDVSAWLAPNTGLAYDEETGAYTVTEHVYNLLFCDPVTGEQLSYIGPLQGNDAASLVATGKLFYADYYKMELEVLSNVKVDKTIVIDYPMTINLNGKTMTAATGVDPMFRIESDVIVTGEGKLDARNGEAYVFILGKTDGTKGNLTIENGTFYGEVTVASVTNGKLTINGGKFAVNPYKEEGKEDNYDYLLNCIDANYKNGTAVIEVNGGMFHKFNPANNAAEGAGTSFCAEDCVSEELTAGYFTVRQANYVAEVNGVKFESLAEAVAVGGEVVLLKDIELTETITVEKGKKVTLDLNGKTITGTDNATKNFALIEIQPGAELTVKGEGKITLTAINDRDWNAYSSVISNQRGKLTVDGGTIEHLGGTDMAYAIDNLTNGKGTYAETVVNGGTIKSTYRAIRQFLNGVEAQNILTINGGTIEGANKSIWMQDPSKNANSGELTVDANAVLNGDVYLTVTAGSTEWPVDVAIAAAALAEGSEVLTTNVPEGYVVENANGVWGVREANYVAHNATTGVGYESFAEAWVEAEAGQTIELLAPIVVNAGETLELDKAVTITYTSAVPGEDMITNRGTLVIDGATLVYTNTDTTASNVTVSTISCEPGSVLEVKSGVVKNDSANNGSKQIYAFAIDLLTNGGLDDVTATISGGEVISTNYMAIRQFVNGEICKNTLNVTGGTIKGATRGINIQLKNNMAYTTITGGTIEGGDYSLCFLTTSENLSVTGGEFKGAVWYSGTDGFISGGTFDEAFDKAYCAKGFTLKQNAAGTYDVVKAEIAAIGTVKYSSLQDAVDAAKAGATIKLLCDAEGPGVVINKKLTINFNNKTYSVTEGVGSAGTESNGFQILKGTTVTLRDGTLKVADEAADKFYILIQNYSDKLTLNNMTLDGRNLDKWSTTDGDSYVLSNNSGKVTVNSKTKFIVNNDGDKAFAFDVCDKTSWGYALPTITVSAAKAIYVDETTLVDNYKQYIEAVAVISNTYYATLQQAVDMGGTVNLFRSVEGPGVVISKDVNINFGNFTYTFTEGVGSTGTESNGIQILKGTNVVFRNGTLKVADSAADKFYILVQNYSDSLSMTYMTLDGTNLDKWSKHEDQVINGDSYVLSNNSGNVTIGANTEIIANNDGSKAFAFDACDKTANGYTLPVVTVHKTAVIEGNIEAAAKIGNVYYATLNQAINAAADKQTVTLMNNIKVGAADIQTVGNLTTLFNVKGKSITLDMNGKTIAVNYDSSTLLYSVIHVADGASLTVKGEGKIDLTTGDTKAGNYDCVAYMFLKAGTSGKLTIENGTFTANKVEDSMVYTNGDKVVDVKGGIWTLDNVGTKTNGSPWIFNTKGNGENSILVSGGTYNFNVGQQYWVHEVDIVDANGNLGVIIDNKNGTWTVTGETAAAAIKDDSTSRLVGYVTLDAALAVAKPGQPVLLMKDIAVEKSVAIAGNRNVVIDLNGHTLSSAKAHVVTCYYSKTTITIKDSVGGGKVLTTGSGKHAFVVQSNLVIDGAEISSNKGGNAIVAQTNNANVTIQNGAVINGKVVVKAGKLTITDGTFNNKLEITAGVTVAISGGYFKESVKPEWCAEGYMPTGKLENGYYSVMYAGVAMIGNNFYETLAAAIAAAEDGETVVLLKDIDLANVSPVSLDDAYHTYYKVEGKSVTIDLNGKTISGAYTKTDNMLVGLFSTEKGGHLTLNDSVGNAEVNVTATGKVYSLIANYEDGCSITINGGTYTLDVASDSLVYSGTSANEGEGNEGIIVNGGTFTLGNLGKGPNGNGSPWIFNALGRNARHIWVTGGTFNADVNHQYWIHEVQLPNTLAVVKDNNGTWTVVDAAAYVVEIHKGYKHYVGYETVEEAEAAAAAKGWEWRKN